MFARGPRGATRLVRRFRGSAAAKKFRTAACPRARAGDPWTSRGAAAGATRRDAAPPRARRGETVAGRGDARALGDARKRPPTTQVVKLTQNEQGGYDYNKFCVYFFAEFFKLAAAVVWCYRASGGRVEMCLLVLAVLRPSRERRRPSQRRKNDRRRSSGHLARSSALCFVHQEEDTTSSPTPQKSSKTVVVSPSSVGRDSPRRSRGAAATPLHGISAS